MSTLDGGSAESRQRRDFESWLRKIRVWRNYAVRFWQLFITVVVFLSFKLLLYRSNDDVSIASTSTLWVAWLLCAVLIGFLLCALSWTFGFMLTVHPHSAFRQSSKALLIRAMLGSWYDVLHPFIGVAPLAFALTAMMVGVLSMALLKIAHLGSLGIGFHPFRDVAGGLLGIVIASHGVFNRRYVLRFPVIQRGRFSRFKGQVPYAACTSAVEAVVALGMALALWRISLINALYAPSLVLETSMGGVLRVLWDLMLISLAWELCVVLVQIMHTQELSSVFLSQRRPVSRFSRDSSGALDGTDLLLEGVRHAAESEKSRSSDDENIIALCVFAWLQISLHDPTRRKRVFDDTVHQSWNKMMASCCSVVSTLTTDLQGYTEQHNKVMRERKIWHQTLAKKAWAWVTIERIHRSLMERAKPSPTCVMRGLFSNGQVLVWAVRAMAHLIVASKTEDRVGVVQSSEALWHVLHCFIECIIAIEELVEIHMPNASSLLSNGGRVGTASSSSSSSSLASPMLHASTRPSSSTSSMMMMRRGKSTDRSVVRSRIAASVRDKQGLSLGAHGKEQSKYPVLVVASSPIQLPHPLGSVEYGPAVLHRVLVEAIYILVEEYYDYVSGLTFAPSVSMKLKQFLCTRE